MLCSTLAAGLICFLQVVLLGSSASQAFCFVAPTTTRARPNTASGTPYHSRLFATSRREEEIAKLEEQLRQLRAEQGDGEDSAPAVTTATTTTRTSAAASTSTQKDDEKGSTLTLEEQKIVARLEKMKGKDMLLSETELIGEGIVENAAGDGSGGNVAFQAVGAIVALVLVIAFAQIPVGQEGLAQYSATGSSNVKVIDLGDLNAEAPKP